MPLFDYYPRTGKQKRPFIIKSLTEWNPDEVFVVGDQPINMMLVQTEYINGAYAVTQMKISDGTTTFKDLKNLVVSGLINGGAAGQTLEKNSVVDGDAAWADVSQNIADSLVQN